MAIQHQLVDPAQHIAGRRAARTDHQRIAFDVVVPSLPGFGFSSRPAAPGLVNSGIADLWCQLMTDGLGYGWFGAHGSDIGAGVTTASAGSTRTGWPASTSALRGAA